MRRGAREEPGAAGAWWRSRDQPERWSPVGGAMVEMGEATPGGTNSTGNRGEGGDPEDCQSDRG